MAIKGTYKVLRNGRAQTATITPVPEDRLYAYTDKTVVEIKFEDGMVWVHREAFIRELIQEV